MRNFLFVQWINPTDASRFVIDGKTSEYSDTAEQNQVMKIFAGLQKYKEICNNTNRSNLSPSFRCSQATIDSCLYNFVEGNFEETDSAGRKLVYIFGTADDDPLTLVNTLSNYASLLGVTAHAEDLEIIKTLSFKKNNNKALCLLITIAIFLLLFMLLNLLSRL